MVIIVAQRHANDAIGYVQSRLATHPRRSGSFDPVCMRIARGRRIRRECAPMRYRQAGTSILLVDSQVIDRKVAAVDLPGEEVIANEPVEFR